MMNYIWAGLMVVSILCAMATGRMNELSDSIIKGAEESIQLVISMLGMMCLWTGIMRIADKGGLTTALAKFFRPVTKILFPEYDSDSKAIKAICMNITANLLGLGNAATPLGIEAIKQMHNDRPQRLKDTASNSMVTFVVINTASLQLIPTMMIILRVKYGSLSPLDIMPAVWITSICTLLIGVVLVKVFERRENFG